MSEVLKETEVWEKPIEEKFHIMKNPKKEKRHQGDILLLLTQKLICDDYLLSLNKKSYLNILV